MKQQITIDIELTPEELAISFCDMPLADQAKFFNVLAEQVTYWNGSLNSQLHSIAAEDTLTPAARYLMQQIGAYSYKYTKPNCDMCDGDCS